LIWFAVIPVVLLNEKFENVSLPTVHENPATTQLLNVVLPQAPAKADDAPSNGDIPTSKPATGAAAATRRLFVIITAPPLVV
jgi:hypothetical protein